MTTTNIVELEKSTRDLILSVVDILAAGGPPFTEAVEGLSRLLRSTPLLDPENISKQARHLADQHDSIYRQMSELRAAGQTDFDGQTPRVKINEESLPTEISAVLIAPVNHVISLRPHFFQEISDDLIHKVETGG